MKNILLIYNISPEYIKYYLIPVDHPDVEIIKGSNGAAINMDDPTDEQQLGVDYINDTTTKHSEFCVDSTRCGKLLSFEVEAESLIDTPVCGIVVCTFYL